MASARSTLICGFLSAILACASAPGDGDDTDDLPPSKTGAKRDAGSSTTGGSRDGGAGGTSASASRDAGSSTGTAAGPRDVNGPCKDLQLLCFDIFDMWIINPSDCMTCNSGKGCQGCAIPFAF